MLKNTSLDAGTRGGTGPRSAAGSLLRAASRALDALAQQLAPADIESRITEPVLEFHADAGAPEGALYVNGCLVGHVVGVSRL